MGIFTDALEQMAHTGKDALETIRHRLKNKETIPSEELQKIVTDALEEMEAIDFNAQYHSWYLYGSDKE
jgi:hypothetical protein